VADYFFIAPAPVAGEPEAEQGVIIDVDVLEAVVANG
jgi:hypothetical protein